MVMVASTGSPLVMVPYTLSMLIFGSALPVLPAVCACMGSAAQARRMAAVIHRFIFFILSVALIDAHMKLTFSDSTICLQRYEKSPTYMGGASAFSKGNVLLHSGGLFLRLTFGRPLSRLVRLIASNGLISLLVRFTARVPEGYDVDDVVVNAIHHLSCLATKLRVDIAGNLAK